MQITQLKLLGFKSFVEPTELIIRPGLTGVVGPNGCGKSNLLEALRWVMGESSYKAMRGSGMDDVIFAGTQQRPPRNSAEVSILVDNSSRTAPAEFNDEDVLEITRAIHRGDGSSYRVNGRDVRAKDVKLLFEDAATGARSHALVRQGQIGEIVNSKPQARRRILEDAAGIAGLHSRRHEAELRLTAAEGNLERLADIMGQMEAQLNSLKRQARHALKYKELSTRLQSLEALLHYLKWQRAGEAVLSAENELNGILSLVGDGTVAETTALTQREELANSLKPLRDVEAEHAAALHRLTVARDGLDRDEATALQRVEELKSTLGNAMDDLGRDEALIKDGQAISERLQVDIEQLDAQTQSLHEQRELAKNSLELCFSELKVAEKSHGEVAQKRAEASAGRSSLTADLGRQENRLQQFELQLRNLKTERDALVEAQPDAGVEGLESEIETLEEQLNDFDTKREQAEGEAREVQSTLARLSGLKNDQALQLRSLQTEIALLEKLLKPQNTSEFTAVMDELQTKRGFELALWAALGDDLDAPLLGALHGSAGEAEGLGDATASNVSSYWRDDLTPFPPADLPALPLGVKPLSDFVSCGDEMASVKRRLAFVGVVDEEQAPTLQAKLHPGQCLVSKTGGLWRWDGYVISPDAPSSAPQRLTERNRLPLLSENYEALLDEAEQLDEQIGEASVKLEAATAVTLKVKGEIVELQQRLKQKSHELREREARDRAMNNRLAAISEGLANCNREIEQARHSMNDMQEQLSALPLLDEIEALLVNESEALGAMRTKHSDAQLHWAGLQREDELNQKRLSEMKGELKLWGERVSDALSHVKDLSARIEKTREELKLSEDLPASFMAQRSNLLDEISAMEVKRRDAADALASAENMVREHEKNLRRLQAELMEQREEKARAETRLEGARSQLMQIAQLINSELNVKPDGCLALSGFEAAIQLPPLSDVEQDVARLKRDRDRLGAVNLRAEDEIRALDEQFGSMISERDDLTSAVNQLRRAVNQLNDEGRQRLLKAFDEVNIHFKRLFKTLFAGGEAELKLVESDDPLESGLEIIARPPGKKPQVLTLLSGGEKALTAMSLIFAVFLTNPSPICVLDEVDAPLDDSNVDRFCLMMEEMARSTETRFLVITHHPMTMERMDRLFGVTMSEKGVSQLVSVDLATAEGLLETA